MDATLVQKSIRPRVMQCMACGGAQLKPFYSASNVPANSCILFSEEEQALNCPLGNIELVYCADCGFIFNEKFDSGSLEYSSRYEETQGFSPTFSNFHKDLAKRVIDKYQLAGKRVVEIGCGKGEFLLLLARLGNIEGIGIDPSAIPERISQEPGAEKITLIPEYYTERHGDLAADAIICKMTLEHIPAVEAFVSQIRRSLKNKPDTVVLFQVPDALRILQTGAFEDVYHEHCSYFTAGSLAGLFRRCGFDVNWLATEYSDQYLLIGARPSNEMASSEDRKNAEPTRIPELVDTFAARVSKKIVNWRNIAERTNREGKKIVLWGSGSKAVSFLKATNIAGMVEAVVDINPNRPNHYMPMSALPIVAPQKLQEIRPGLIIVMNSVYLPEIARMVQNLKLGSKIQTL